MKKQEPRKKKKRDHGGGHGGGPTHKIDWVEIDKDQGDGDKSKVWIVATTLAENPEQQRFVYFYDDTSATHRDFLHQRVIANLGDNVELTMDPNETDENPRNSVLNPYPNLFTFAVKITEFLILTEIDGDAVPPPPPP